ncbi:CDP-alcohol phosphatidyltransferase family protein [Corynebacterium cystitidis]|uniref:CDP-alcohol phosphatidyltransferase family protein n=1 Tax=Corynebacterium cystitidis TaxID=35757 RepID=UPI00211EC3EB|nr:CDP-alcohol phosphatidyltransferase family protein [Corynebacterium cystitidis]
MSKETVSKNPSGNRLRPPVNGTAKQQYRWAIHSLSAAQKPAQGVPAYTRWVNRRGARVVAAFAYALGWTPNMVTAISAILSLIGMIMIVFAPPVGWTGIVAAIFFAAGYLFDSADGQLARVSATSSATGEWVDHVVDAFRSPAIHGAVAIAIVLHRPDYAWLAVVAVGYSIVTSGQFLSQILAEALIRKAGRAQTRGGNLRSWILLPTDPGILCWTFILWGSASLFSVGYGLLAAVAVAHALVSMRRRYQDLQALDVAGKEAHLA